MMKYLVSILLLIYLTVQHSIIYAQEQKKEPAVTCEVTALPVSNDRFSCSIFARCNEKRKTAFQRTLNTREQCFEKYRKLCPEKVIRCSDIDD